MGKGHRKSKCQRNRGTEGNVDAENDQENEAETRLICAPAPGLKLWATVFLCPSNGGFLLCSCFIVAQLAVSCAKLLIYELSTVIV